MKAKLTPFVLIAVLVSLIIIPSCEKKSSGNETKIVIYDNRLWAGCDWRGGHVYSEMFTYTANDNPSRPDKFYEYTAYRMMIRDDKTGVAKSLCVDPLCTHEPRSDCPMVSDAETNYFTIVRDRIFILRYSPQNGSYNGLIEYNLLSGEKKTVFEDKKADTVVPFDLGNDYIWYIIPDVVEKKTVYQLIRYEIDGGTYKNVLTFDEDMLIYLCTDARIYLGKNYGFSMDPEKLGMFSVDFEGNDRREEPSFLVNVTLAQDTFLLSRVKKAGFLMMDTPHFIYYDILTRTHREIPQGDCALSIGYNESDGRFYYISCEHADAAFFPLHYYKRAEELGISYEELLKDRAECEKLDEDTYKAYHEDRMYLKSCSFEGDDIRTHFEFSGGGAFHSHENYVRAGGKISNTAAYYSDKRTANVSADGKWYYVTVETHTETGVIKQEARISLETGEIEFPQN